MSNNQTNQIGPFTGTGVFTTFDPLSALALKGSVQWVAVMPDAKPSDVQQLKNAGFKIVVWQAEASQAGLDAVNKFGASGYIAQAEGPGQMQAAQNIAAQVNVPKALVTNLYMQNDPNAKWPPGWIAMPEAYQNANPNASPGAMLNTAKRLGAATVIPVLGAYDASGERPGGSRVSMNEYFKGLKSSNTKNYAAYSAEYMTDDDKAAMAKGYSTKPQANKPASNAGSDPNGGWSLVAASGNKGNGAPQPYTGGGQIVSVIYPKPNITITTLASGEIIEQVAGGNPYTIRAAWPPPYTGGSGGAQWIADNPDSVRYIVDKKGRRVTITTTASGAVIEQVAGGNPYRVKAGNDGWQQVKEPEPVAAVTAQSTNSDDLDPPFRNAVTASQAAETELDPPFRNAVAASEAVDKEIDPLIRNAVAASEAKASDKTSAADSQADELDPAINAAVTASTNSSQDDTLALDPILQNAVRESENKASAAKLSEPDINDTSLDPIIQNAVNEQKSRLSGDQDQYNYRGQVDYTENERNTYGPSNTSNQLDNSNDVQAGFDPWLRNAEQENTQVESAPPVTNDSDLDPMFRTAIDKASQPGLTLPASGTEDTSTTPSFDPSASQPQGSRGSTFAL